MENGSRLGFVCVALLVACAGWARAESEGAVTDAQIVAIVDEIAGEAVNAGRTVGLSVAVERGGTLVIAKGYGLAELENDVPATEKTVYRIGSVTKQFTAAAIMQLIEQGKLKLDDEITKFVPDYPTQDNKVTVHHLLTHTSGIKNYTSLPDFWKISRLDTSREDMIELFGGAGFDFKPGEKWQYSNSGYYLLGIIIEKVSGKTYEEYLGENIFKRGGLESSYYLAEKPIVKHRAQGYSKTKDGFVNDDLLSMDNPYAAGSLGSTVTDLIKWNRALAEGKTVSPESYKLMITPAKLNNGEEANYGYGLMIGKLKEHRQIEHGGGINGFSTQLTFYPEDQLAICVLTNTMGSGPAAIEKKIARRIFGIPEPQVKNVPLAEGDAQKFTGKYDMNGNEVIVYKTRDRLMIRAPEQNDNFPITYQGDNTFLRGDDTDFVIRFSVQGDKAIGFEIDVSGNKIQAKRKD